MQLQIGQRPVNRQLACYRRIDPGDVVRRRLVAAIDRVETFFRAPMPDDGGAPDRHALIALLQPHVLPSRPIPGRGAMDELRRRIAQPKQCRVLGDELEYMCLGSNGCTALCRRLWLVGFHEDGSLMRWIAHYGPRRQRRDQFTRGQSPMHTTLCCYFSPHKHSAYSTYGSLAAVSSAGVYDFARDTCSSSQAGCENGQHKRDCNFRTMYSVKSRFLHDALPLWSIVEIP